MNNSNIKNSPLVSVVVPVYNVDKYIGECIDSLLSQSYEDIEIILVNDGSTDRSSSIIDSYSRKNPDLIIINKKNGGLSDARNAGIKAATGEYIMFLDSDDYVTSDFVESALNVAMDNDADIVAFRFTSVTDGGEVIGLSSKKSKESLATYSKVEAIRDIFTIGGSLKVNAWNKIYKRSLFIDNNIEYPKGKIYEDNQTTYKLLYFAKRIMFVDKSLLFYRQRPGSIMKNKLTNRGIEERYRIVLDTLKWLKGRVPEEDLRKIGSIYKKTMMIVLMNEAIKKRQLSKVFRVAIGYATIKRSFMR